MEQNGAISNTIEPTKKSTRTLQHCYFPNTQTAQIQKRQQRSLVPQTNKTDVKHTFIILDGTWKQASKMFHQSEWAKRHPSS